MAAQKAGFKLFNTRYEHFYNIKLLYSGYLSYRNFSFKPHSLLSPPSNKSPFLEAENN